MSDTFIPNSFQCPNAYVDRVMAYLTGSETKVLFFAIREIYGWRDSVASRRACIALSVFSEGKRNKAGEQLCNGCGLGVGTIRNAIKELCRFGIMVKMGGPGPSGQEYFLQDNADLLNWAAMKERRSETDKANTEQMADALKKRGVMLNITPNVEHKGGGNVEPHATPNVEHQEGNTETQLRNPYIDAGQKTPAPRKVKAPKADIPEAVKIYREVFQAYPKKNTWATIAEKVVPHNGNMGLWREILEAYKLHSDWNRCNIAALLDYWENKKVPTPFYTQSKASRARQPLTQAEAQALYDAQQREKANHETP